PVRRRLDRAALHQLTAHVHERGGRRSPLLHPKSGLLASDSPPVLEHELPHRAPPLPGGALSRTAEAQRASRRATTRSGAWSVGREPGNPADHSPAEKGSPLRRATRLRRALRAGAPAGVWLERGAARGCANLRNFSQREIAAAKEIEVAATV